MVKNSSSSKVYKKGTTIYQKGEIRLVCLRRWEYTPHLRPHSLIHLRLGSERSLRCSFGFRTPRYSMCCWNSSIRILTGMIDIIPTHLTRSKTDTRFPTGLSREFPSGVNSIFPCLYTVPQIFENCDIQRQPQLPILCMQINLVIRLHGVTHELRDSKFSIACHIWMRCIWGRWPRSSTVAVTFRTQTWTFACSTVIRNTGRIQKCSLQRRRCGYCRV